MNEQHAHEWALDDAEISTDHELNITWYCKVPDCVDFEQTSLFVCDPDCPDDDHEHAGEEAHS